MRSVMKPARALVSIVALMLLATPAVHAATFTVSTHECGGARGGGQTDTVGNLYVACNVERGATRPHIQVFNADGVRTGTIPLTSYATDVAPAPDGNAVYVFDRAGMTVRRWNRQLNGSWMRDPTWRLAKFARWGRDWEPTGEFLASDDTGNIYVSTGTWTTAPNAIVKYAPDGSYITDVGDFRDGWALGDIYWMNTGVAVSPDGRFIYLSVVGNNRIERYDRTANGSYVAAAVPVGNTPEDPDPRVGWCGADVRPGRLAAPYDIGLDGAGRIFVANTSCSQVKIFDASGVHQATIPVPSPNNRIHGIAVDRVGRVVIGEASVTLTPTGVTPLRSGQANELPGMRWATAQEAGWAVAIPRAGGALVSAWRWSPNGWTNASLARNTDIWVQPFATGWLWAWHNGSWHAVRVLDVAVRRA